MSPVCLYCEMVFKFKMEADWLFITDVWVLGTGSSAMSSAPKKYIYMKKF